MSQEQEKDDASDRLISNISDAVSRVMSSQQYLSRTETEQQPAPTLHESAKQGNVQALELLIGDGADVNELDEHGMTAMHWAAMVGATDCVTVLAQNGAKVDVPGVRSANGQTPFMWAASHRTISVLKEFISLGANIEARDAAGNTAMTLACKQGHVHVMHFLVQQGASLTTRDNSKHTLLHWATYMGHANVVEYLFRFYPGLFDMCDIDNFERNAVHWACRKGFLDCVRILACANSDEFYRALDAKDDEGKTPMTLAEENNHQDIIRWLTAMTSSRAPIPFHPLKQRAKLLLLGDSVMAGMKWCICTILLSAVVTAYLPLCLTVPLVAWLGYTSFNYLSRRNFRRDVSPILAISLHLPGLWMGVALSGLVVFVQAHILWGVPLTMGMKASLGVLCVVIVMFVMLMTRDPGCILHSKAEFEDVLNIMIKNDGLPTDEINPTRMTREVPRAHMSSVFGCRIGRYDHFCVWLQMPVGYNSHLLFTTFLILHCIAQASHLYLSLTIVLQHTTIGLSTLWTCHWTSSLLGASVLNGLILAGISMTTRAHVLEMFYGNTCYELTHRDLWYMKDGLNPFSHRPLLTNFWDFVTMHRRKIGGYGDVHLEVPPLMSRKGSHHGHSHSGGSCGYDALATKPKVDHSIGGELRAVCDTYKQMRSFRTHLREMTSEFDPTASNCSTCN